MSRDWTPAELQAASEAMKTAGNMNYEEFCEELDRGGMAPAAEEEDKNERRM